MHFFKSWEECWSVLHRHIVKKAVESCLFLKKKKKKISSFEFCCLLVMKRFFLENVSVLHNEVVIQALSGGTFWGTGPPAELCHHKLSPSFTSCYFISVASSGNTNPLTALFCDTANWYEQIMTMKCLCIYAARWHVHHSRAKCFGSHRHTTLHDVSYGSTKPERFMEHWCVLAEPYPCPRCPGLTPGGQETSVLQAATCISWAQYLIKPIKLLAKPWNTGLIFLKQNTQLFY